LQYGAIFQSIPEDLRNGEILGYRLQSDDPNGINHSFNANSTSAEALLVLYKNHVLHLSAFTSAGSSVTHSILFQENCNGLCFGEYLYGNCLKSNVVLAGMVMQFENIFMYVCMYVSVCMLLSMYA